MKITWYFDFISPFAYLQHVWLKNHAASSNTKLEIEAIPILFAGLLNHWEHKGPAEIPAKRVLTYQHCLWLAEKNNIPFKTPPAHPFNPLNCLRLSSSCGNTAEIIDTLFDVIWAKGLDITNPATWEHIAAKTGLEDIEKRISDPDVKKSIRNNTDQAIEGGVFGVPTLVVKGKIFWGFDMTEMALHYATDSDKFESGEYLRLQNLPVAKTRDTLIKTDNLR